MDEEVRHTDYGDDTQAVESHAAPARFDPQTGERLKRLAVIVAVVFGAAFLLVSVDRIIKAYSVARETRAAATERANATQAAVAAALNAAAERIEKVTKVLNQSRAVGVTLG